MYWLIDALWRRAGWASVAAVPDTQGAGFGLTPFGTGPFGT